MQSLALVDINVVSGQATFPALQQKALHTYPRTRIYSVKCLKLVSTAIRMSHSYTHFPINERIFIFFHWNVVAIVTLFCILYSERPTATNYVVSSGWILFLHRHGSANWRLFTLWASENDTESKIKYLSYYKILKIALYLHFVHGVSFRHFIMNGVYI